MAKVSKMEHIFPSLANPWSSSNGISLHRRVYLGVKVSGLNHHDMVELSGSTISHYKKAKYLLLEREGVVRAIIHKQATPADILQSFIHALVLASLTEQSKAVHIESRLWMDENYNDFITKLRSGGWEVERLLIPSIVWRAQWDFVSAEQKIK